MTLEAYNGIYIIFIYQFSKDIYKLLPIKWQKYKVTNIHLSIVFILSENLSQIINKIMSHDSMFYLEYEGLKNCQSMTEMYSVFTK